MERTNKRVAYISSNNVQLVVATVPAQESAYSDSRGQYTTFVDHEERKSRTYQQEPDQA
jgi:hypothetical protein